MAKPQRNPVREDRIQNDATVDAEGRRNRLLG